ncbi:MAG TPA: zinc-dependent metalloprotease [Edaphocola sp.]|nr:zinc-dependent metalloprotease [Edaphocola sp.]
MRKVFLLGLVAMGLSLSSKAQSVYWQAASVPNQIQYQVFSFKINTPQLKSELAASGNNNHTGIQLLLPNPQGKTNTFNVWRNTLIPASLQSKFPDVWAFTAVNSNTSTMTAKIEFTNRGLFAMVYDGEGTYFIDPIDKDQGLYKAYYKSNAVKDPLNEDWTCGVDENIRALTDGTIEKVRTAGFTLGDIRRTYRLALSCTGEYAIAVAGSNPSKNDVFAAMTTTINRVNGIYEREVAITMEFIPNNDTLIYTNPITDPFTANNNGGQLLTQNQNNTTTVIGSLNYDIGHIFSTGAGGIAYLGSVCSNSRKARGVTGRPNPIGDPFDVDYVSHEMGHQFGADHSFNVCSGTESQYSAYEPGGGTTIMAYAGICGSINNVQMNSNDYFHKISLDDIQYFFTNLSTGTCAVTDTGYNAPVINVIATNNTIPKLTPFELDYPSTTPDSIGNIVKGNIEQYNLGNFSKDEDLSPTFTTGPAFRSFTPDTITQRVFPRMTIVRSGLTGTRGERLSEVGRAYKFAYNAREVRNDGWGAVNSSDVFTNISVTSTAGPFVVLYPSVGDSIKKDDNNTIYWDVANTNLSPVNCATVDVYLSIDGGETFPIILASAIPNTGNAVISIPDLETNTARIKIKGSNNIFFNISKGNVVIGNTASTYTPPPTGVKDLNEGLNFSIYPNPAHEVLNIAFEQILSTGSISILNTLGQEIWKSSFNAHKKKMTVPTSNFANGVYWVKVIAENGNTTVRKFTVKN